jgi:hypothetical protein
VRVRDNGSGMKAELVPKVFDLFTQGERTPDRSQGGPGHWPTWASRWASWCHGVTPGRRVTCVGPLVNLPAWFRSGSGVRVSAAGTEMPLPIMNWRIQ